MIPMPGALSKVARAVKRSLFDGNLTTIVVTTLIPLSLSKTLASDVPLLHFA